MYLKQQVPPVQLQKRRRINDDVFCTQNARTLIVPDVDVLVFRYIKCTRTRNFSESLNNQKEELKKKNW